MKSILLTTTAIVAFAGAAAADGHAGIGFAGEATLGYNTDDNGTGDNDGFYWDSSIDVTMTAALDNGITATADFGVNVVSTDGVNDSAGSDMVASDFVLKLAADNASLTFGTVDPVAEANWGGVDGATVADFNDLDVHVGAFDSMLVGEITMSDVTAMVSMGVGAQGSAPLGDEIDAYQVYVSGDFGSVSAELAYQAELGGADAIIGVSASTSAAGADITAAYINDGFETSMGLAVSYPVAAGVTAGGYFSLNDEAENNFGADVAYEDGPVAVAAEYDYNGTSEVSSYGVEGSYDTGMGATILAGYLYEDGGETSQTYIAGTYDLGGGASVLVSYGVDEDGSSDEIGDPEYQEGTTVEVSFSF